MIGIGKFVLAPMNAEALAVPIWWAYATSLVLNHGGIVLRAARLCRLLHLLKCRPPAGRLNTSP